MNTYKGAVTTWGEGDTEKDKDCNGRLAGTRRRNYVAGGVC
jgi:hypothetical protein